MSHEARENVSEADITKRVRIQRSLRFVRFIKLFLSSCVLPAEADVSLGVTESYPVGVLSTG